MKLCYQNLLKTEIFPKYFEDLRLHFIGPGSSKKPTHCYLFILVHSFAVLLFSICTDI